MLAIHSATGHATARATHHGDRAWEARMRLPRREALARREAQTTGPSSRRRNPAGIESKGR
jgi:hypothetical protein